MQNTTPNANETAARCTVAGRLVRGHGVASGQARDTPYRAGTIALQTPHFLERGLDVSPYYAGTLNVSIAPYTLELVQPTWHFPAVRWTDRHPPETFSFVPLTLATQDSRIEGLLYVPHPATKNRHLQPASVVEVLAPYLSHGCPGTAVTLSFPASAVRLIG